VTIRPATSEDLSAIAQVHVEAWQQAYRGLVPQQYLDGLSVDTRENAWIEVFDQGASLLLVAEDSGSVIGFSSYGASREQGASLGTAELYAIYVAPQYWSTGVGRGLFQRTRQDLVERGFDRISVWVLAGNERAIRFYRANGFQRVVDSEVSIEIGGKEFLEIKFEIGAAVASSTQAGSAG
jgi:ribosomal protein S18 acetylase RimI-like enzyme